MLYVQTINIEPIYLVFPLSSRLKTIYLFGFILVWLIYERHEKILIRPEFNKRFS